MDKIIGVLALQGSFIEHANCVERLGLRVEFIRYPGQLERVAGLIIPGGESTTIIRLMLKHGLFNKLKDMIAGGFPVFGTCAGLIVLSRCIIDSPMQVLEAIDIFVERNSYGRQIDSFEEIISIPDIGKNHLRAVFIRAPRVKKIGKDVKVMARLDNRDPVLLRQNNVLVASFHPELSDSTEIHNYFVEELKSNFSPINT